MRVGAVQHRDFVAAAALLNPVFDTVDDETRLVFFVVSRVKHDRFAGIALGPELLAEPRLVIIDQRVCGLQYGAGGTVILFQPDHQGIGEVLLEMMYVFDARTAPAVNRLIVVTDDEHRRFSARHQA